MIRKINKLGLEEALKTNGIPIVVDFATDWCPYCKRLLPIMEEIADEYQNKIQVYYVNTDDCPDVAEQYDIMTVPTVFVFLNGEIKKHAVNPRSKKALLELIFKGD